MEDYRQQLRQQREQQLQEQLAQTDSRATPHGVQVHLVEGRPYLVVLDAIDEFAVDLLIMGTSGRGGLPGVLVGNTAEHLLSAGDQAGRLPVTCCHRMTEPGALGDWSWFRM